MTMNPYQSLGGNGAGVVGPGNPGYGVATPFGAGQNWTADQLGNAGWWAGMPAPQLPFGNDPNYNTYYDPSSPGNTGTRPYDQGMLDASYKVYQQTHDPIADAKLAAYNKSMGMNTPGGIIPPTADANQDPWGTLNSMGIGKPSYDKGSGMWSMNSGAPYDPWQPFMMDPNQGVNHFGTWYGTGALAAGNGPGGYNPNNVNTGFMPNGGTPMSSGPWGNWDAGGVGMGNPPPGTWFPKTGQGTNPWYG